MVAVRNYYEVSNWFATGTSNNVTGVAWTDGDLIVTAQWVSDQQESSAIVAPTNANLTFTLRQNSPNTGSEADVQIHTAPATSTETAQTITSGRTGATNANGCAVWVLQSANAYVGGFANNNESATTYNPGSGSAMLGIVADWSAAISPATGTTGSGTLTERQDSTDASWGDVWVAEWIGVDAGSDSWGITSYSGGQVAQAFIEISSAVSNELEGFRFEKDHASEAGDWWAAQDTNPTGVNAPFGLRAATVFTGDPASASFKIAGYRRVGDTIWDGPPT
jgi:hypothetical protein